MLKIVHTTISMTCLDPDKIKIDEKSYKNILFITLDT